MDAQNLAICMANLHPQKGQAVIACLGQAGFWIKTSDTELLIDPYLSNSVEENNPAQDGTFARAFPPPVLADEMTTASLVFLTHDHGDHTDPETIVRIARASPQAQFIAPWPVHNRLKEIGIPSGRCHLPETGRMQALNGVRFTAVPAAHYGLDQDVKRGFPYFGYVIESGEVHIYHAGDTILYPGMLERLEPFAPLDLALLPVNGRDYWREQLGMIGNLNAVEAVKLAARLQTKVLIPMHNDLFAANHVSLAAMVQCLEENHPRQRWHGLQPGEIYLYVG